MDSVEIVAGSFQLRPCQTVDTEWICRACQDPGIQRWTRVPSPYRSNDAFAYVTDFVPRSWDSGRAAPFGVFDAVSGEGLGTVGLVSMDLDDGLAEIGYWVAPWARGRGVATAGTLAVARWAFGTLGIARLSWMAEVGNNASRAVAERTGFTIEGTLRDRIRRRDGSRADAWIGSLLPTDLKTDADARRKPSVREGSCL